jgi:hypothetical protein
MSFDSARYKFILTYDILPETQDRYYQYVLGEMVPALQSMGLVMNGAWHTAFGDYPMRLVEFVAEDYDTLMTILDGQNWATLHARLQPFVTNYSHKIVKLREDVFQF